MAAYQQVNNYLNNHYEGMEPEQLILLLFNGALSRLKLTRQGIVENDVKKRGENLSKAIAIISELHSSVDSKMDDESTVFLRGLYTAILTELPKISLNNNLDILNRAESYIQELKNIWEQDVIGKTKQKAVPQLLKKQPFPEEGHKTK
ncbi:MAG: flagellar export chaperone FliS, partial [Gammaproteobacteria bacterium]|nr:flagellar export chaperone FliS [Gammaproteobacteria bacterium]